MQAEQEQEVVYNSLEEFLVDSARYGEYEDVMQCISENVNINWQDQNGNTALHMACANNHLNILDLIINQCPNLSVNVQNENGSTPLHWAAFNGKCAAIQLLLMKGADANIQNKNKKIALDEAILQNHQEACDILLKVTNIEQSKLINEIQEEIVNQQEVGQVQEETQEEDKEEEEEMQN